MPYFLACPPNLQSPTFLPRPYHPISTLLAPYDLQVPSPILHPSVPTYQPLVTFSLSSSPTWTPPLLHKTRLPYPSWPPTDTSPTPSQPSTQRPTITKEASSSSSPKAQTGASPPPLICLDSPESYLSNSPSSQMACAASVGSSFIEGIDRAQGDIPLVFKIMGF
ncbi:hypothetical protein AMTR_s00036p00205590, partial [Amborella trichopoda]